MIVNVKELDYWLLDVNCSSESMNALCWSLYFEFSLKMCVNCCLLKDQLLVLDIGFTNDYCNYKRTLCIDFL